MKFKSYPSIENSYRTAFIERFLFNCFELKDQTFAVLEKLHGTNLQIMFEPNSQHKFASRNQFCDEGFFNLGEYFKLNDLFLKFGQNLADALNSTIRLYGEFFGQGIMKGVNYGNHKQFRLFDIHLYDFGFFPYRKFCSLCDELGITQEYRVPFIEEIKFEEIFNYNSRFDSKILGISDNICEGVVVRPMDKEFINKNDDRFILKIKNEEFREKSKQPKVPVQLDDDTIRLNMEFRSYINDSRLQGIFSKNGMIKESSEISKFIRLLVEDGKNDFRKDFPEVDSMDKSAFKGIYNIGSFGFELLKKYLN